jgi:hypothetical protein
MASLSATARGLGGGDVAVIVWLPAAPDTRETTPADEPYQEQRASERANDDTRDCTARDGVRAAFRRSGLARCETGIHRGLLKY